MSDRSLWTRIRDAHLVQVLLVYVGASWLVLQIVTTLREALTLPEWIAPVSVILLLIGLVIVLATAWVQAGPRRVARDPARPDVEETLPGAWELDLEELTESVKRGRLPHLTWGRALLGGVVAFSLLFGFAGLYVVIKNRGGVLPTPTEAIAGPAPAIAVLPFRVVGHERELWREGLVDALSYNLEGAGGLRKIDPRTVISAWRDQVGEDVDATETRSALAVAEAVGARYALSGSMVGSDAEVRITAELYDVRSGELEASAQVDGSPDSVLALVDRLSVEILRSGLPFSVDVHDIDLSRAHTRSLAALKAYLEGERKYRRSRPDEARADYLRALEADSTFALALYRLALIELEAGSGLADVYFERAGRLVDRLPERERQLVRAGSELSRGRVSAISTLREFTRRYPDDVEGWYLLGAASFVLGGQVLRPREEFVSALQRAIDLSPYYGLAYVELLHDALNRLDRTRVRELLDGYARIDAKNDYCIGFEIAHELNWGGQASPDRWRAVVDTVGPGPLGCTIASTMTRPQFRGAVADRLRVIAATGSSEAERISATSRLVVLALYEGKYRKAQDLLRQIPMEGSYGLHGLRMRATLNLIEPNPDTDFDWVQLLDSSELSSRFVAGALAARVGQWEGTRVEVGTLEADAAAAEAAGNSVGASELRVVARSLEGYGALQRGDSAAAISAFEQALPLMPGLGPGDLSMSVHEVLRYEMGRMLLERGDAPGAERYLSSNRLWSSPVVTASMYYLGRAYEMLGDVERAREQYGLFVEWWADADPELEPRVEDARARLERLSNGAKQETS